ncbi:MAG: DUF4340 domain-containing protein [Bacteroidales bacterium]|nr:DUF4340 domain-containing protein [Bacteroidales bacterium]
MNKKRKKLFPLFLFLLIPIIWFTVLNKPKDNISKRFIIDNVSNVYSIKIKNKQKSITIKRKENTDDWFINDKYEAEKKVIKKLFQAFTEVKINKPVPKEKIDSVKNVLIKSGKTITVYDNNNEIIKEWHIADFEKAAEGTYIISDFKELPYIVSIPGLEKDLNRRYNLHPLYWINPEIFSYKPHEITEIEIKYSDKSKTSYKIEINNQTSKLYSYSEQKYLDNIKNNKIGSYLSYFMNVKFSDFNVLSKQESDSLKNINANFTITVKDIYNGTKTVELYKIKLNSEIDEYDFNKLYAIINNEDIVIVKYYDIDLILKDINYFIK